MKYLYILLTSLSIFGCSSTKQNSYYAEKKLPVADWRTDLTLLKEILETKHPSLYWYTPKDSIDYYFNVALTSASDSLSQIQFKNKVAWVISKIRCGHTAVRSSKNYVKFFARKRTPQFPLSIKVWNDSAVIISNAIKNDSILKRGVIIKSINNIKVHNLVDSMFQLMGTDGYINNFKQQIISFNFPFYYKSFLGLDSTYSIAYVDSIGVEHLAIIKNFVPKIDTTGKKRLVTQPRLTKKDVRKYSRLAKRSMVVDTILSTAILRVSTFAGGHLNNFFKKSFKKINAQKLKNIVIDLRENSGGNVMSSTRLTQYLIDRPFKIADTVAAIDRSFKYRKYIKPSLLYWLSMHITGRRRADGRIHFNYFERHFFKPKKRHHFDGKIYLIASGFSFSASTLFIGALKGQENVRVIGEETGGGSYGNSAMHLPVVTLPKSKIRVVLPLYKIVIDKDRPKTGRGIFPDIEVQPSSSAIKNNIDLKMEKVKALIQSDHQNGLKQNNDQ